MTPFRVGHVGIGAPQMSVKEAIKKYGNPEINSEASPVASGTVTTTTAPTPREPVEDEEPRPPAFLPPFEDVSGSVVANDAKPIWEAAEFFHTRMYAAKRRTPPDNTDQRFVAQYIIAAHVTRGLRAHNADMPEQAWEQRAAERLPRTRHNYLAAIQHDLSEQFPARYSLREGGTWEANARYARHSMSLKPQLKSALQCARYCVLIDSTCRSNLPIDSFLPDVLAITMPLARIPEMADMVVAMFDPNLTGLPKEPPPQRVIIANVLDHMACEGLLMNLDTVMNDVKHPERAGDLFEW